MRIRDAEKTEIDQLAQLWYDGWQDAHAQIVPAGLARLRTRESFRDRMEASLAQVRVAGRSGEPVGFCLLKDSELYQLYVDAQARGSGVAAALMLDAEQRLAQNGVETAWLACAIGNLRAARFYEKNGWQRVGTVTSELPTIEGVFRLDVWRYEKHLTP